MDPMKLLTPNKKSQKSKFGDYTSMWGRVDEKIDKFFLSLNKIDRKRRPETRTVPFEASVEKGHYEGYVHAAHAMIWSPPPSPELNYTHMSSYVNMQLRFDGQLGFPGGAVDDKIPTNDVDKAMKIVTSTVVREIKEEINFDVDPSEAKYVATFVASSDTNRTSYILHTFLVQLTPERFKEMELKSLESTSEEVQGNIRVPLCTKSDKLFNKYLSVFLMNRFISIADRQLMKMMMYSGVISEPQLENVMRTLGEMS